MSDGGIIRKSGVKDLASQAQGIPLGGVMKVSPQLELNAKDPQILDAQIRGHLAGQLAREIAVSDLVQRQLDSTYQVKVVVHTAAGLARLRQETLRQAAAKLAEQGEATAAGVLADMVKELEP